MEGSMVTMTAPVWLLTMLGVLAVAGFCAVFVVIAGWLERARDWWQDGALSRWWPWRQESDVAEEEGAWETPCPARDDGIHCDHWYDGEVCCACGDNAPESLELPPERTWEQMTSHQLPITGSNRHADDLMDGGGLWHGPYAPERERRAPWWEVQQRAAYESLGLDYPSGLMARVRELTP